MNITYCINTCLSHVILLLSRLGMHGTYVHKCLKHHKIFICIHKMVNGATPPSFIHAPAT